jgi:biopolymer transport protein ExbD
MGAMSSAFNTRRHRKRPSVNITSLIDVMFLLLIFFMVSSTFRHEFGVDVTLPEASTAVETEASAHEITVTEGGAFHLGQREVTEEGLRTALSDLILEDPEAKLVLRADAKADFGRVVRAMDIARDVGGSRLIIPTQDLRREVPEN